MSTATAETVVSTPGGPDLMPIPLATLCASMSMAVDLYLKSDPDGPPTLYRQRKYPVTAEELERLVSNGFRVVYIPTDHVEDYQHYLRDNVQAFLNNDSIPPTARVEFLSETARELLPQSFNSGNTDATVEAASELSDQMVGLMSRQVTVASDLFSVLRHDYHTFTHLFNVASYTLMLAKALGITDEADLGQIAVGGLLHDVGKLRVPLSILNKKGALSDKERRVIQRSPHDGFVQLSQRDDLSWGQLMMVYQHHERVDGGGYPVGVGRKEIHEWGKLCAVVDVFEAMTAHRPYRKALPLDFVLDHLKKLAGVAFDEEMVKCWIAAMKSK